MKPRSAKAKGRKLEKLIHDRHKALGVNSRLQPGSGIFRDFPHDNRFKLPFIGELLGECKARKSGLKTLQGWLGRAQILFIKPDYEEPWVAMPWSTYSQFLTALIEIQDGIDRDNQRTS